MKALLINKSIFYDWDSTKYDELNSEHIKGKNIIHVYIHVEVGWRK